jgi:hypothetical protein
VLLSSYGNVPSERAANLIGMPVSAGFVDLASERLSARLQDAGFDDAMQVVCTPHRGLTWLRALGSRQAAAITRAASGVPTVAASAFSQRTSRLLPWILVWPNAAPRLRRPLLTGLSRWP